ncbi:MAG: lipoyl(octanoyl) transferase LipB [Janthinobacterium lividum]
MRCQLISYPKPVSYAEALATQYVLAEQRGRGEIPDTLLLLEHPPTITLGRRTDETDLRTSEAALVQRGFAVERVDRGGEITYHGPGQLVGYPILDLRQHGQDLHKYLRDLEEVLIRTIAAYGLAGERVPGRTGVWVNDRKIAAIGIKVSRWVSLHGFALNISPDLAPFRNDFVPCGISDRDVTSLAEMLGKAYPKRSDTEAVVIAEFQEIFGVDFFC